jgi:hypothetical protein
VYENTIIFGLEIVYMLNTIYDTMTKAKLSDILTRAETCDLENLIFKKDKVFIEPAISLPDDAEKRFNTIRDYVCSKKVQDMVTEMVDRAYRGIFVNSVSLYFGTLISYAINLSIKNIRVKQCAILYNYCKANALFKPSETDPEDEYDAGEDDDEESSTTSTSSTFKHLVDDEIKESTNMLDLREDRRRSRKTAPGGGHESSPVFEALDGLIDNFRQDKYKFTVTDIVSTSEEDRAEYEAIASKVKLVNSVLTRQIREIKTYNVGGKNAGLSSGKLDRKSLHKYKTNKDIFYQNTYKIKECDPAFGIVLDASGSMCGRGIADGRVTMIVLHETLKALGVNHSIVDHTCYGGRYECDIRRYYSFKEDKTYKITKNYGIVRTTAESGNCDSGALYFMEKALLRTKNRDKICLIFSDGAPTECTGTDLVEQVRHMERCGIKVIGIGINFPNISKYYGTYANGKNLQDMLNIVSDILKEYVLTKKE